MLLVPLAAAAVPVLVAPGAPARAVTVLAEGGKGVVAAACNDAGVAPDEAADGRWSCDPLDVAAGDRVGLLRDARFLDLGAWAGGGAVVAVVEAGRATLGSDPASLPAPSPATPAGPGAHVLARIVGAADGPMPMARLAGDTTAELACTDDGSFPDEARNDRQPGCIGVAPGLRARVQLDQGRDAGEATWEPAPLRFLRVDDRGVDTRPFRVSFRPMEAPAPGAQGGPPAAPPPDAQGGPSAAPSGSPRGPDLPASPDGWRWPALGVTAALASGIGWLLGRPRALPRALRPLSAAPLFPGGPSPGGPPAVVPAADLVPARALEALARTHRVVLVGGADLPPVAGAWVVDGGDRVDVEDAVRALVRLPGLPVAVLVVGDALRDPGAVTGEPWDRLVEALPAGVWALKITGLGGISPSDGSPAENPPPGGASGPRSRRNLPE